MTRAPSRPRSSPSPAELSPPHHTTPRCLSPGPSTSPSEPAAPLLPPAFVAPGPRPHHRTPLPAGEKEMPNDAAAAAARQRAQELPLEQPPPLSKMLDQDRRQVDDCTPCRVMGASAFIGLGIYSYVSGHSQLRQERAKILASKSMLGLRARKASITGLAATLVGLGVYRLVN